MINKKNLFIFEILSTLLIIFLGFILHFAFEWFNYNPIIGSFSSINESTWEHLKLLFFPMLLTIIIGYLLFKNQFTNYLCIKTRGLFLGMIFIVIFFYTYSGIIGKNIPFIDISSFIIAVLISEIYTYRNLNKLSKCNNFIYGLSLLLFTFLFITFTFNPPEIDLFKDPITDTYGLNNK